MTSTPTRFLAAPLRRLVVTGVQSTLGGAVDLEEVYGSPDGDVGFFGPSSVAWTVHGDLPAMLIGGLSALMYQTLHPLAMAGVAAHSLYREDPLGRLRRTAHFIAGTTFGPTALAESLVERVKQVHSHVVGIAQDGRPYAADDPALLTFVHATEVDGFLRSYQRYAPRPLLRDEKDRYVAEMSEIARRLGAIGVPRSVMELRSYLSEIESELMVTPEALEAISFLKKPQGVLPSEVAVHMVVTGAAIDLLPVRIRSMLGLHRSIDPTRLGARIGAAALARTLRWAIGSSQVRAIAARRATSPAMSSRNAPVMQVR